MDYSRILKVDEKMKKGIYKVPLDYRFIRHIRLLRNKTLADFSNYMNVDAATISRLENNKITFTPFYESKLRDAIHTKGE